MADRLTIADLLAAKRQGQRIVAVSCYDYTTARLASQTDVQMVRAQMDYDSVQAAAPELLHQMWPDV